MLMLPKKIQSERPFQGLAVSVIVPTYKEKDSIAELIDRIESSLRRLKFDVIIVDDASPDGTAECVEDLNDRYGNIRVIRRAGKLGLSSAVVDGFKSTSAGVLGVMDADLQHPPELLLEMYEKICEGHDLVVASRYVDGGEIEGLSSGRRIMSKAAAALAHFLLPEARRVRDVVSGFFMLRREVIEEVELRPVGYKILLEIVVRGRIGSVVEVPYTFKPRRAGKSSIGLGEIWNYVVHIRRLLQVFSGS